MRPIYLIFLLLNFSFCSSQANFCKVVFSERSSNPPPEVQNVLDQFEFPADANVKISNAMLREAVHKAYGGKDLYTGQELRFEDMRIDHIIPKSKGGPDNIFNYVPTSGRLNSKKNAKFDPVAAIPLLFMVRTTFAPKVVERIEKSKAEREREKQEAQQRREKLKLAEQERKAKGQSINNNGKKITRPKVVAYELDFTEMDPIAKQSLLLIKEFVENNRDSVVGDEIFVSEKDFKELRSRYTDFSFEYVLQILPRKVKRHSDGTIKSLGISRIFGALDSAPGIERVYPDGTAVVKLEVGNLNPDIFDKSFFHQRMMDEGGYILDVNREFHKFVLGTSVKEFRDLIETGRISRDYFVNPEAIRIEPLTKMQREFLHLVRQFGQESNVKPGYYEINIEKALDSGFGGIEFTFSDLVAIPARIGGSSGKRAYTKLLGSASAKGTYEGNQLRLYEKFEFLMKSEIFNWLKSQTEHSLDLVLESRNLNREIEFPVEATPLEYRRNDSLDQ